MQKRHLGLYIVDYLLVQNLRAFRPNQLFGLLIIISYRSGSLFLQQWIRYRGGLVEFLYSLVYYRLYGLNKLYSYLYYSVSSRYYSKIIQDNTTCILYPESRSMILATNITIVAILQPKKSIKEKRVILQVLVRLLKSKRSFLPTFIYDRDYLNIISLRLGSFDKGIIQT